MRPSCLVQVLRAVRTGSRGNETEGVTRKRAAVQAGPSATQRVRRNAPRSGGKAPAGERRRWQAAGAHSGGQPEPRAIRIFLHPWFRV